MGHSSSEPALLTATLTHENGTRRAVLGSVFLKVEGMGTSSCRGNRRGVRLWVWGWRLGSSGFRASRHWVRKCGF